MIDNRTRYACACLGVSDQDGEPALCVVVEATCACDGSLAEVQPEIVLDGVWDGDPATTAPLLPPVATRPKRGTDVLLTAHGIASLVELHCGPLHQRARLHGPRTWVRRWCGVRPGPEAAFVPVPLRWEQASGPQPTNPLGCGLASGAFVDGVAMPAIEHPDHPLRRWGRPAPAVGFAATTPAWAHRRAADTWAAEQGNAAAPELIAGDGLCGNETVQVRGIAGGNLDLRLPGLVPPRLTLARRCGDLQPEALLDTVLIDGDARHVRLTWRAWCRVGEWSAVETVLVQ
jgi:hypothetical protein